MELSLNVTVFVYCSTCVLFNVNILNWPEDDGGVDSLNASLLLTHNFVTINETFNVYDQLNNLVFK